MVASFAKAPLVEIIAELRWSPGEAKETDGDPVQAPEVWEKFFDDFGREVEEAGYPRSERILPSQIPPLMHSVTYRHMPSRASADSSPAFLQVGPGIFSANALQTYKTWAEFQPALETGIAALLKSFDDDKPFTLTLRYVNAFHKDLYGDRTAASFITDVLGFRIDIPAAVSSLAAPGEAIRSVIQTKLKTGEQTSLSINIGEGRVAGKRAVVLDWMTQIAEVDPDADIVLKRFGEAHQTMHDLFFEITKPIHDLMQPKED